MKKQKTTSRLPHWLILLAALSLILASCSDDSGNSAQVGPATIKVMYWNEQSFLYEYGMLFYALHPEIEVEVVNTSLIQFSEGDFNEKLDELIRNEKPDILLLSREQYEKYAAEGRLVSLESYVARDKFDLDGLIPGLVDLLREEGGGELYGLTPRFSSQALYYNKDLFDRFGIDYPTDRMSWEDVLNLAGRFPTDGSDEDRIYGLHLGTANVQQVASQIGATLGLQVVNPADNRVSINTDSWVQAYEMALKAIRSGMLYQHDPSNFSDNMSYEDFLLRDPFIGGKAAMSVSSSYLILQIREAAGIVPDRMVKNWGLVTVPVDPANPDYSNAVTIHDIFAINAESANREAAWAFIRYLHSDEHAQVKSKSLDGQFPVRTKYIRDDDGRNLAAFWSLKPASSNPSVVSAGLPDDFYMHLYSIGNEEMQAVLNDEKTVREALADMQNRLQAALDASLADRESGEGGDR